MPPTHTDEGLRAAQPIRAELPETGVLVLSQYLDEDYVFALLGDGAERLGYMLKDRITDGDAFVDAVRRVAAGDAALDPEVVAHLLGRSNGDGPLDELTERERTVLAEMAEGRSNPAIAARMFLSDRAVERHVTAIFSKLGLTATPRTTAACSRCSPISAPSAHMTKRRDTVFVCSCFDPRGGSTRGRRRGPSAPPGGSCAGAPCRACGGPCGAGRCGRRRRCAARAARAGRRGGGPSRSRAAARRAGCSGCRR